jgi:rod shape determining protein RodA
VSRGDSSFLKNIDWATIGLYLSLAILGCINIYAAKYDPVESSSVFSLSGEATKQFMWLVISLITASAIMIIDFKVILTVPYLFYGVTTFLLLLVLLVGVEINGARSWIPLGFSNLQPSELAKVGTALAVANFLENKNMKYGFNQNTLTLAAIIAIPPLLILMQPDAGSALVFGSFIILLFIDGLNLYIPTTAVGSAILFFLTLFFEQFYLSAAIYVLFVAIFLLNKKTRDQISLVKVLLILTFGATPILIFTFNNANPVIMLSYIGIGIVVTVLFLLYKRSTTSLATMYFVYFLVHGVLIGSNYMFQKLPEHQQNRLLVLKDPYIDPRDRGWNIIQSKIAISSGGAWGKGFTEGTITKGNWVPEQHTDFIFCTIGEEHGFVGSTLVVALYVALLLRLAFIADRQKSRFARVYGYSIAGILFVHFTVNVGMVLGLLPVIGIPLPFFSYGGSSLWAFSILLFLFIKLDTHRSQILGRG